MRRPSRVVCCRALLHLLTALACAAPVVAASDAPAPPPWPPLGVSVEAGASAALPSSPDGPITVRVVVRRERVDGGSGRFDWTPVREAIDALAVDPAARVVVTLTGGDVPRATEPASLDAWLAFVRAAVRELAGRADVVEVWDRVGPESPWTPEAYAFVLKNSALAIRAEAAARGAEVSVAQAALAPGALDWQRALWGEDAAAYVDVLPLWLAPGEGAGADVEALIRENLSFPPAATVIGYAVPGGADAWTAAGDAVAAVAAGAAAGVAVLPSAGTDDVVRWTAGAAALLAGGYGPAPEGDLALTGPEGGALPAARLLGRFVSDVDFSTLVAYRSPGDPASFERDRLGIDAALVRDASVYDPVERRERRVSLAERDDGARGRVARVFRADWPLFLRFERPVASPGFDVPTEEVETRRQRELTVEEVVARYQAVQRRQDDLLERWIGRGRTDLHFKFAQGGASVDVGIETTYFWERGGQLEWEQTDYYINGNRVGWKKIPELPLIQPEKVVKVPLDLTLDRTYLYRLIGRDTVEGEECYEVEFQPADPDAPGSLYRGRVWIDAATFVRRKASVIQTNLEAPVISNEEIHRFRPHEGPDGRTYYLLDEIYGQQIWKAGGATFVVQREQRFSEFDINPAIDAFEQRRSSAYASTNLMLRETDEGQRYLERTDDGGRRVKTEIDTSQIFMGFGAFNDGSTGGIRPLAGVNYFNYNVRDRNLQINAFFAGVLGFFTASDPDLFGTRLDLTANAFVSAIRFEDDVYLGDRELVAERIRTRNQNLSFQLGLPVGQFLKLNAGAQFVDRRYFDEDDASAAIDAYNMANPGQLIEFRLPADHRQVTGDFEIEFNRRGWTLIGEYGSSTRSEWEPWGMVDTLSGEPVAFDPVSELYVPVAEEPLHDPFSTWNAAVRKEFFLRRFQKLRAELNYLDGADLDRFSRYQFSLFGDDRLSGFSGTGVRFDRGLIGRFGYSFNLFEVIRLDAILERARVEIEGSPTLRQDHTGIGISANLVGPWRSIINFNYGYALDSDIPDLEGEQEFLLIILKLF